MIGKTAIFNIDGYEMHGIINDIVSNANEPLLYGILSNERIYYCKEDEIEII